MKKIFALAFGLLLVGCGSLGGFSGKLSGAVQEGKNSVKISDLTSFEWTDLRILHPYESKTLMGTKYEQSDDKACLWVFMDAEKVVKTVSVSREDVDCIDLPSTTVQNENALFLIRDGKLKERKKFKMPTRG